MTGLGLLGSFSGSLLLLQTHLPQLLLGLSVLLGHCGCGSFGRLASLPLAPPSSLALRSASATSSDPGRCTLTRCLSIMLMLGSTRRAPRLWRWYLSRQRGGICERPGLCAPPLVLPITSRFALSAARRLRRPRRGGERSAPLPPLDGFCPISGRCAPSRKLSKPRLPLALRGINGPI